MEELGFNKSSSHGAKKAFVRHLVKAAQQNESIKEKREALLAKEEQQLTFSQSVLGIHQTNIVKKKKTG